jgi:hypothetical protein
LKKMPIFIFYHCIFKCQEKRMVISLMRKMRKVLENVCWKIFRLVWM